MGFYLILVLSAYYGKSVPAKHARTRRVLHFVFLLLYNCDSSRAHGLVSVSWEKGLVIHNAVVEV
jgi:hypothetical protein